MTDELSRNGRVGSEPRTETGRRLLDHIARLDYDAYDAARALLVDEREAAPTGNEWAAAILAIEEEAGSLTEREYEMVMLLLKWREATEGGDPTLRALWEDTSNYLQALPDRLSIFKENSSS